MPLWRVCLDSSDGLLDELRVGVDLVSHRHVDVLVSNVHDHAADEGRVDLSISYSFKMTLNQCHSHSES